MGPGILEPRVQGEHHRPLRDGRLQPDAGDLPVRPARPVRLRPDRRRIGDRAERRSATSSGSSRTSRRRRSRTRSSGSAPTRRRSGSPRSSAGSGSAPRSGGRWTPPSAGSTTSSAAAGCAQKRFSLVMLVGLVVLLAASVVGPDDRERALSRAPRTCRWGLDELGAIRTAVVVARRLHRHLRRRQLRSTGRCRRATCRGARSGPARSSSPRRRASRNYVFPLYLTDDLRPRPARRPARLRPGRAALVLRRQPDDAGRRGDQLPARHEQRTTRAQLAGRAGERRAGMSADARHRSTEDRGRRSCPIRRAAASSHRPTARCARSRRPSCAMPRGSPRVSSGTPRRSSGSPAPTGGYLNRSRSALIKVGYGATRAATSCSGGGASCC